MRKKAAVGFVVASVVGLWGGGRAPHAEPGAEIAWVTRVVEGFEKAAKEDKVLMICINATNVPGEREEPAAKGLREIVYKHADVVAKSRSFVCVFLTPKGSSDDYGEMRIRFGIDGDIVSPQHVFADPNHLEGSKPLLRRQYWYYGSGERAVKALLALMDKALTAYRVQKSLPDPPPPEPAGRKAWIGEMLGLVRTGDAPTRIGALRMLGDYDEEGDCARALVPLVTEFHEAGNAPALSDVIRVLGVPGLEAAAEAIHPVLGHGDDAVRGNAAVTLEYIGSAASAAPLLAQVKKEKNANVANHLYRALGRCGKDDAKAKKRMVSRIAPKKDGFTSYGPAIGLGYCEGDPKLARSIEKRLLKLGSPFAGFDYGKHTVLRAILMWSLAQIADPDSATFIRKKLIPPLEEEKAWGKRHVLGYYDAVARRCAGDTEAASAVESGMGGFLWFERGRELLDEYRIGRSVRDFAPKGEWGRRPDEEDG